MPRLRALDGVLRGRDDDLYGVANARFEQISGWRAAVSTNCQKPGDWRVDLIQKPGQGHQIANVIQGQIRADDLSGHELQAEVQLAPGFSFGLCFMLFLQPVSPSPKIFIPVLSLAWQAISPRRDHQMGRLISPGLEHCGKTQTLTSTCQLRGQDLKYPIP
ncbi:MAG: hypothetical protein ACI8Q6_004013 [Granulosicoccus sp.]|jgi:hypothetical protein